MSSSGYHVQICSTTQGSADNCAIQNFGHLDCFPGVTDLIDRHSMSHVPFHRSICQINLQTALDALHNPKEDGQKQDQNCDPERVPLHTVASVTPPLSNGARSCLVVQFFQRHEIIVPEFEVLNLPLVHAQSATFNQLAIEIRPLGPVLSEPTNYFTIRCGE